MMRVVFLMLVLLFANICSAKIWMPTIISDNMVLQQQSEVTVWGWTTATNEVIKVRASWDNSEVTTKAYQGVWSVKLSTPEAGGPFILHIKGHEEITLSNIMIGEVWLASGQSNMEWTPMRGLLNASEEIKNADYPNIRFFKVVKRISQTPQDYSDGEWMPCTPETIKNFSSVGYFFGRNLRENLSVPVGIINASWGGTPVEAWMPREMIEFDKELAAAALQLRPNIWSPDKPGLAFNAMIHPLINFNIAGAIWYQGESNRVNAPSYYRSFPLLINIWRELWKKEFPFYFVQIAPFDYEKDQKDLKAAIVRDAQLQTMLSVPKTGMVVTNDIGDLNNIHPVNKQEVGQRLALWALAQTYGVKGLEYCGPIYKSMEIKKQKVIIEFDHAPDGLQMKGKKLKEFFIAGSDKQFYQADAKIVGSNVVVSSKKVKHPVAVRFAFYDKALPNLYNAAGLPASAFRTDDWELEEGAQ